MLYYLGFVWYALNCFADALLRQLVPTSWWPKKSLRGKAVAYTVDVSKPDLVYQTADEVRERFGSVDVVVNNAGVSNVPAEDFFEIPDERNSRLIDINLKSLFWMAKAFLPDMLEKRSGHFACVASITSFVTFPAGVSVDYSGSKFGVFGVMETLEHMLWLRGDHGVRFTTCFPAWVPTKLADGISGAGGWPVISTGDCAEQVIQAIELERRFTFIPGREAWIFFFKGLLPWNLYTKLIICGFER